MRLTIKRLLDLCITLPALLLLSPVMLLIYLLLLSQGGKPIFRHQRVGQYGKPFYCLKFRTMVLHAETILEHYLATHPEAQQEWRQSQKLTHDPRVTWLGHFLRKTSLDELPQLWNVLVGEMSLVGPRPIVAAEMEKYRDAISYYLQLKPGMTGLWQVSGRSNTPYAYRVLLDRYYATHASFCLDLCIILKTIPAVLNMRGAR